MQIETNRSRYTCIHFLILFRFKENGGQTEQKRIDDLNEVSTKIKM